MAYSAIISWKWFGGVVAAVAFATSSALPAHSEEIVAPSPDGETSIAKMWRSQTSVDVEPSAETWTGADGHRHAQSIYTGVTVAPLTNLRQDGIRLRAIFGGSLYRYASTQFDAASQTSANNQYSGTGNFVDLLAGYQFTAGAATIKAFAGYGSLSNVVVPFDPGTSIQGRASGAKGVLEVWQNWTPSIWTSVDLAAARAHETYSVLVRMGYRFAPIAIPSWSLGPELAQVGNSESVLRRAGLFLRRETIGYEFTLSGGMSKAPSYAPTGYVSGQWLTRF